VARADPGTLLDVTGSLPRRGTDRVEDVIAWVLGVAALLLLAAAIVTGLAVHRHESERADIEAATVSQTRAVLLDDAKVQIGYSGEQLAAQVPARWIDRAGREHTGLVVVERTLPAGSEVDVWIDEAGERVPRPTTQVNAVVGGIVAASGVLIAGGSLLAAAWLAVRLATAAINARRWNSEWTAVEPDWRRDVL
jgi:hypothetical protein